MSESIFDTVESAINDIADGKLVIVTDDEDRENEGDLIMAASKATPEAVNMMIRYCSGIVCVPATEPQLKRLGLNPMVVNNRESHRTDFTVSVDAAEGITTGISAYDRTVAIRLLADANSRPEQLVQPGHVFPLRARPGGVLERAGHTEAAVDLASLAGCPPVGVICEVVNEDGTMARLPDLVRFKEAHGLRMISIAQLIAYRHRRDRLVEEVSSTPFECAWGTFDLRVFKSKIDGSRHYAMTKGDISGAPILVRVQAENLLGDVFGSGGGHSRRALETSLAMIQEQGRGVFLYMSSMHSGGMPVPAQPSKPGSPGRMDFRHYGVGAQILSALGVEQIRLISGSHRNVVGLEGYGLIICERIPFDQD